MLNLLNNQNDREMVINQYKTNILGMLKGFEKLNNGLPITEPMACELFSDVTPSAIKSVGTRNKKELEKYGYRVIEGEELKEFRENYNKFCEIHNASYKISPKTRKLRLYTIDAVIIVGMLLEDSKIAEQLRQDIINFINGKNTLVSFVDYRAIVEAPQEDKDRAYKIMLLGGTEAVAIAGQMMNEKIIEERLRPLVGVTTLVKNINVPGITSASFFIFLTHYLNLGDYVIPYGKQRNKFYPNQRFEDEIVKKGWGKYVDNEVKFYVELAEYINNKMKEDKEFANGLKASVRNYNNNVLSGKSKLVYLY